MKNAPSFIGDFHTKPKPSHSSRSAPEIAIEVQADLREKRKQILQRLKQKNDLDHISETIFPSHRTISNEEIAEKVIFSPRTAKRFQQHKRSDNVKQRASDSNDMPTIVLEEAQDSSTAAKIDEGPHGPAEEVAEDTVQTNDRYIPSFADKPSNTHRSKGSPSLSKRKKSSPKLLKKTMNSRTEQKCERERSVSESLSPKSERKVLNNTLSSQKPPLLASASLDVDNEPQSSPLRRSASFHSLQKRNNASRKNEERELLGVNNSKSPEITTSLPSIRQQSSSLTSIVDYQDFSSTKNLKTKQEKLEEDFHKLEQDLDRAFSELRKYLKTS